MTITINIWFKSIITACTSYSLRLRLPLPFSILFLIFQFEARGSKEHMILSLSNWSKLIYEFVRISRSCVIDCSNSIPFTGINYFIMPMTISRRREPKQKNKGETQTNFCGNMIVKTNFMNCGWSNARRHPNMHREKNGNSHKWYMAYEWSKQKKNRNRTKLKRKKEWKDKTKETTIPTTENKLKNAPNS